MVTRILVTFFLAGAACGALADASVDTAGEALVEDFLTNVITFEGRFEQKLIDARIRQCATRCACQKKCHQYSRYHYVALYKSCCGFQSSETALGTRISRLPFDCNGPTSPAASIVSTMRAARL